MLKNDTLIGKSAQDLFLFSTEGPYPLLRHLDLSNNVSIFFFRIRLYYRKGVFYWKEDWNNTDILEVFYFMTTTTRSRHVTILCNKAEIECFQ